MPVAIRTRKQLGRALGTALFFLATIPAAMADCSTTDIDRHAEYAKVEVKNNSDHTFIYNLYVRKADDDYGDATESVALQSGEVNKYETDQMHDNTQDYIKVVLKGEWQEGPGITQDKLLAVV